MNLRQFIKIVLIGLFLFNCSSNSDNSLTANDNLNSSDSTNSSTFLSSSSTTSNNSTSSSQYITPWGVYDLSQLNIDNNETIFNDISSDYKLIYYSKTTDEGEINYQAIYAINGNQQEKAKNDFKTYLTSKYNLTLKKEGNIQLPYSDPSTGSLILINDYQADFASFSDDTTANLEIAALSNTNGTTTYISIDLSFYKYDSSDVNSSSSSSVSSESSNNFDSFSEISPTDSLSSWINDSLFKKALLEAGYNSKLSSFHSNSQLWGAPYYEFYYIVDKTITNSDYINFENITIFEKYGFTEISKLVDNNGALNIIYDKDYGTYTIMITLKVENNSNTVFLGYMQITNN